MINIDLHKSLKGAQGLMPLVFKADIKDSEFVTLYGPSGAGKTSILRMICGLLKPDEGKIIVDDETWFDAERKINLSPQKRNVGIVFQDYGLFPHMNVREHLLFALPNNNDLGAVDELLEFMELKPIAESKPIELSGGQKQRIALARTLIQKPKVLLLDEPLSAIDYEMRKGLQKHIKKIHNTYGLTTILVSHEMEEILTLSDRILRITNGKVTQQGKASIAFPEKLISTTQPLTAEVIEVIDGNPAKLIVALHGQLKTILSADPEIRKGDIIEVKVEMISNIK